MRTRGLVVLSILLPLLSACGEDQGSPPALTAVSISGFPNSDPAYLAGFNEGSVPMAGFVDFEDPDGDVVLLHVAWRSECGSGPLKKIDILREDLRDEISGSILFVISISTDCPIGEYTVQLSLTDGQGNTSNVLDVRYEIYE
jgi:hypothetical protein